MRCSNWLDDCDRMTLTLRQQLDSEGGFSPPWFLIRSMDRYRHLVQRYKTICAISSTQRTSASLLNCLAPSGVLKSLLWTPITTNSVQRTDTEHTKQASARVICHVRWRLRSRRFWSAAGRGASRRSEGGDVVITRVWGWWLTFSRCRQAFSATHFRMLWDASLTPLVRRRPRSPDWRPAGEPMCRRLLWGRVKAGSFMWD